MKRRDQQQGIALVTTLIMLSVVTLMAVAFLAVSRRERAAVTTSSDRLDAREVADAGYQRAEAEILSRVLQTSNILNYEFLVSTNYESPFGFIAGNTNIANVSYRYPGGGAVTGDDLLQVIRNLQVDPRAPVFVLTNNLTGENEFRFFLDFNRNGWFDTNGFQPEIGRNGEYLGFTNYHLGDPEWIGILRRSDEPHSGSNHFVGRYSFLVLPAGKSLDLNFIHNHAKPTAADQDGYHRNQGMGPWELNLAAFLRDLNTNAWDYEYVTNLASPSRGVAFENASTILDGRYFGDFRNLATVNALFGAPGGTSFLGDRVDGYSDGPLQLEINRPFLGAAPPFDILENDNPNRPWPGAPNPFQYFDIQELFLLRETRALYPEVDQFTNRLIQVSTGRSTYDRHTLYRLLGQLGTDSVQSYRGRIHLNYDNRLDFDLVSSNGFHATNFVGWRPLAFFTNAANYLLRALHPPPGQGRPSIAVTNIPVWPTNYYSPAVHRELQVAANIFDATANRVLTNFPYIPSVFRPVYERTAEGIRIARYEELTDNWEQALWNTQPFVTGSAIFQRQLSDATDRAALQPFDVVAGVPAIIGAKKGFPNFNEFELQTVVVAGRKLELVKRSPTSQPAFTNQLYTLSISNQVGVEFWNSYLQAYPRPLELRCRLQVTMALSNEVRLLRQYTTNLVFSQLITPGTPTEWAGNQFRVPIRTNIVFVPPSIYTFRNGGLLLPVTNNNLGLNAFESAIGFPVPTWRLTITNRLQAALIDRSVPQGRLIDYVNLDEMTGEIDITRELVGELDATGQSSILGSFWRTNRVLGIPEGVRNQIQASLGSINVANWNSVSAEPVAGQDKEKGIQRFRQFLGLSAQPVPNTPTLRMQAPLSPGIKLVLSRSWQVNDPLVNDTRWDLEDPARTNNIDRLPPLFPITDERSNLGKINYRYRPWQRGLYSSGDATDFDLAYKDPQITRSDDWDFPTNSLPNVGWLGRIHRGTPWQTLYFKSAPVDAREWIRWTGHPTWFWPGGIIPIGTQPTNDWAILDLFTTALNADTARGQLSVNQEGLAAWSAVLSGVPVLTNAVLSTNVGPWIVQPGTPELRFIVNGINAARVQRFGGKFNFLGEILSTPELTVRSPFLSIAASQNGTPADPVVERIPQMVLSLLRADDPRFVVIAYGQSLRPAPGSVVTDVGPFFQMPTNYMITGEHVTKTLVRLETVVEPDPVSGQPRVRIKPVKESYNEVPPTE